ncbi:MAG: class II fructose-bisphosphate aldolase [Candidatus Pacebacteria bacterium]|nr:class II fructose-bisphosphate aldolase [Candidatus Paceibacterota bacterium]
MKTLRQYIQDARETGTAIGHFNISNIEALNGIVKAAQKLNVPVVIGVSEGERDFIGVHQVSALVRSLRQKLNHPIFLNADHTYSFERVKEAIDAGFDMVITDHAGTDMQANIDFTRQAVQYAKEVNEKRANGTSPRDGSDSDASVKSTLGLPQEVLVEAEIGYIGKSSKVLDGVPAEIPLDENGNIALSALTTAEDAAMFVRETGIDLLAPAVGNIHGIVKNAQPKLNIARIAEIVASTDAPLVLHGASGIGNDELAAAVEAGISMVHYNTELRIAYRDAVRDFLTQNPKEVAPYKFLANAVEAVERVVEEKLRVMNKVK